MMKVLKIVVIGLVVGFVAFIGVKVVKKFAKKPEVTE